jgi:hypothetical protein
VFRRFCYRSAPFGQVYTQTLRAAEPLSRRGLDRGASCRFGLLSEHHQLVTWLNERTLSAARSKRCSSITYIIELFSRDKLLATAPAPRPSRSSFRDSSSEWNLAIPSRLLLSQLWCALLLCLQCGCPPDAQAAPVRYMPCGTSDSGEPLSYQHFKSREVSLAQKCLAKRRITPHKSLAFIGSAGAARPTLAEISTALSITRLEGSRLRLAADAVTMEKVT